jgi:predicted nucleic acid-binding protein
MIIDTSVLVDIQNEKEKTAHILHDMVKRRQQQGFLSFITYFEYSFGLQKKKKNDRAFVLLHTFPLIRPTEKTAEIMAQVKHRYEEKGIIFSLSDLMIASQAIEHSMTLVTKDAAFLKIKEVDVVLIP